MPIKIRDRSVQRIAIVDDEEAVRAGYEELVVDLNVDPVTEAGPLPDLETFVRRVVEHSDAVVCDFKLTGGPYSTFNGTAAVSRWYDQKHPALLCTMWDTAMIDELRRHRAKIPVLVNPSDLDAGRIIQGFETCLEEFSGNRVDGRKLYRTLVRVEDLSGSEERLPYAFLAIPAWIRAKIVPVPLADIPEHARGQIVSGGRLYARVNLGAEADEDLFFDSWG